MVEWKITDKQGGVQNDSCAIVLEVRTSVWTGIYIYINKDQLTYVYICIYVQVIENISVCVCVCVCVCVWLPRCLTGNKCACQCRTCKRCGFDPCFGKISWRREQQTTPLYLSVDFHGQRMLAGYSP